MEVRVVEPQFGVEFLIGGEFAVCVAHAWDTMDCKFSESVFRDQLEDW